MQKLKIKRIKLEALRAKLKVEKMFVMLEKNTRICARF